MNYDNSITATKGGEKLEKKKRHKKTTIKSKETRVININLSKDSKGYLLPRLNIPKTWIDFLKIDENDRKVEITLNPRTKKITIVKCQDNEIVEDGDE